MTDDHARADLVRWVVLVPMKPPGTAKSRLAVAPATLRAELVLAMAGDVVAVCLSCPRVSSVVVVADAADGLEPLQRMGARLLVDPAAAGLNAALRYAAGVVAAEGNAYGTAALVADVAAVSVDQLTRALDAAAEVPKAFVPDAAGRGTTLVAATEAASFRPAYGPGSRRRHRAAGFRELTLTDIDGLRLDVDTMTDLAAVARIGAGPRTRTVLERPEGPLQ